jgi:hypothetical protein
VKSGALFSHDGRFRYRLWRRWAPGPTLVFVMLNPSTADEEENDPTIRKCIGFATRLGFGAIEVVNLYAYCATSPDDLAAAGWPDGNPSNDDFIAGAASQTWLAGATVCCAWGTNAYHWGQTRVDAVLALLRMCGAVPHCLRRLQNGGPWHPLYLPYSCTLTPL